MIKQSKYKKHKKTKTKKSNFKEFRGFNTGNKKVTKKVKANKIQSEKEEWIERQMVFENTHNEMSKRQNRYYKQKSKDWLNMSKSQFDKKYSNRMVIYYSKTKKKQTMGKLGELNRYNY